MYDAIWNGEEELAQENIDVYFAGMKEWIGTYDFESIWEYFFMKKGYFKTSVLMLFYGLVIFLGGCGCQIQKVTNNPSEYIFLPNDVEQSLIHLTTNFMEMPMGLESVPFFSWQMSSGRQNAKQSSYQIVVSESSENLLDGIYIWDSGIVNSDESLGIRYEGPDLVSEKRYFWKVIVWDENQNELISDEEWFETGILNDDWESAKWISAPKQNGSEGLILSGTNYSIEFDIQVTQSEVGLIWGNETNQYGNYFMWGIDCISNQVKVTMSEREQDEILWNEEVELEEVVKEDFILSSHHFRIDVNKNEVITYLDGKHISFLTANHEVMAGRLGTFVGRGANYGYFDNISVKDSNGTVLVEENFENPGNNIFTPFYTHIENGKLRASSGLLLMPGGEEPAPLFRKEIDVKKGLKDARLYISSLGSFETYINGSLIEEDFFAPGASYYDESVYYRTYDITKELQDGKNTVGVMLGHYRYNRAKENWGDNLAFLAKIKLYYEDGSVETIITDENWMCNNNGPVRQDDLFWGEYYDANYEKQGWNETGFDCSGWEEAILLSSLEEMVRNPENLISLEKPPVRCIEERLPINITEPKDNVWVCDFGQNFSGICKLRICEEAGQKVCIRYAEALNEKGLLNCDDDYGTVWTENLYTAHSTDYYVSSGDEDIFIPNLTCHGFRYVQITGLTKALTTEDISALVLSTDNERTGYFECSDENLNQLYEAIYWTQLSNYVDIPTDCPQRDERLAWTGDAQAYSLTASYNSQIYQFFRAFLKALRDGQNEDGSFQDMAFVNYPWGGNNGWGDAGITVVWTLYSQYGIKDIITENMESMCRYMDYLVETSENGIRDHMGSYGDHLAELKTSTIFTDTAQCAYDANLLAQMCEIIGETNLAKKYADIYEMYRLAWQNTFLHEDGSTDNWFQDEYVLGLAFGLYPKELEQNGADKLNLSVQASDFHPMTGYISTPFLLPILTKYGYSDSAYQLLLQKTSPSWISMLSHERTTISESFSGLKEYEDGTFRIDGSLNHYAFGSVGQWYYDGILGIKKDETSVGWKHFVLEPIIGGGLTYASGSYESVYGMIESSWKVEEENITYCFTIPANTTATVKVFGKELELGSGSYEITNE